MGQTVRGGDERAPTGFKTAQDMIVVALCRSCAIIKRTHPFGETGRPDHPFGADLRIGRPPRAVAVKAGRQATTSAARFSGLDSCEHGENPPFDLSKDGGMLAAQEGKES